MPLPAGMATTYYDDSANPIIKSLGHFSRTRIEFGEPSPRINRNIRSHGNTNGIEFGARAQLKDESGISSPPLWQTSPTRAPTTSASRVHPRLTPTSRSQAIAEGRCELMEMIKTMPESAYELSLKDLVEIPANKEIKPPSIQERDLTNEAIPEDKVLTTTTKKNGVKRKELKHSNMANGPFLKMFFPAALGMKKKSSRAGTCSKVSPKPPPSERDKVGLENGMDRDWQKKQNLANGVSQSSDRSSSSGSSSSGKSNSCRRQMAGFLPGCFSFFRANKSKTKGHSGRLF